MRWATPLQPQPVRSAVWRGWALALALLCVLLLALPARAQNANDGFDPTANGEVRAIAVQPDGKVLVGGVFTTLGGQARRVRRGLASPQRTTPTTTLKAKMAARAGKSNTNSYHIHSN